MKCENIKCNKEHDGSFGSGRFCSRSCANSRTHTEETRKRISVSLGGDGKINKDDTKCEWCDKKLGRHQQKYCSLFCSYEHKKEKTDKRIEGQVDKPDRLKEYIIKNEGEVCKKCGQLPKWKGKILVLQLDHINGDSDNNYPSNLRLLCPNCHTQTDTWTSKGYGATRRKDTKRNRFLRRNRRKK